MAESGNNKRRLLRLLRYLYEFTVENNKGDVYTGKIDKVSTDMKRFLDEEVSAYERQKKGGLCLSSRRVRW